MHSLLLPAQVRAGALAERVCAEGVMLQVGSACGWAGGCVQCQVTSTLYHAWRLVQALPYANERCRSYPVAAQYAVDCRLDELLAAAWRLVTEPPLPANPYPRLIHLLRCAWVAARLSGRGTAIP